jgi:hypothetical protein
MPKVLGPLYLLSGDGTTGTYRRYDGPTSPYALRSLLERESVDGWAKLYEAHPVVTTGFPITEAVLFQIDAHGVVIGSRSVSVATLAEADRTTVSLRVCRQRIRFGEVGPAAPDSAPLEWRTRIRCYSGEPRSHLVARAVAKLWGPTASWQPDDRYREFGQVYRPLPRHPDLLSPATGTCRVLFE